MNIEYLTNHSISSYFFQDLVSHLRANIAFLALKYICMCIYIYYIILTPQITPLK